ncbi:hypothetical protein S83_047370, partial [Arachis hypogaea]
EATSCPLSKKEQGIIHMVAGLGYEWALIPILNCGVNINFHDIRGWTALHWVAQFGRIFKIKVLFAFFYFLLQLMLILSQIPIA